MSTLMDVLYRLIFIGHQTKNLIKVIITWNVLYLLTIMNLDKCHEIYASIKAC
ncbi:hypothetical protein C2G38_2094004 [Gigaspora rosea]|uniref:Uncharacterized protein n=1 Tax=Gigaspora rosea TaxID=44941 RepID=A0A397UZW1_9GLOM|nr:hypothetical protein C2G38_2094004 [Gigaspora rosea]